jgi:signal transduction histidine kinase
MKLQAKLALATAALVCAVIGGVAFFLVRAQTSALERQSRHRLETLMEGVGRIAREAIASRDELMLVSYLMTLQKEHKEFAFADVYWEGHKAPTIGKEGPGTTVLSLGVSAVDGAGGAERKAALRLGFTSRLLDEEISRETRPLLAETLRLAAVFVCLGILAAWIFAWQITRSIHALAAAAEELGKGRFNVCVPMEGSDEVAALGRRFNAMTASLRELMTFREDMLHALTHELNNPLAGVKAYLELLEDGKIQGRAETEDAVNTMSAAVKRMEVSLARALALFKSQSRSVPVFWTQVSIRDVLNEVARLFAPVAEAKGVALYPISLGPEGLIGTDPEMLRQIASNLISNAVKYTPSGGEVRVGLDERAREVVFWVRDTGAGISAQDLPRIFEKFDRSGAGDGSGGKIPGTGLGLSIVRSVVRRLRGKIRVESEVGKGTVFTVELPKRTEGV